MSYTRMKSIIFILPLIFLVQTTLAIDPLYHICSDTSGNFMPNSPYQNNLLSVLTYLQSKTSPTGFSLTSIGQTPSKVYGLALCRGDVNATACYTCVLDASSEALMRCPSNKGAIIWYDNCMLKYLNQDFFGKIDNKNKFYLYNIYNISNDPSLFNNKVMELLSKLANKGASSKMLYAEGEMKLDTFTNLYGLAQCTRDLSSKDCKVCLDEAIRELPKFSYGKQGGRVVGGSCNVRYEIYPFVNS